MSERNLSKKKYCFFTTDEEKYIREHYRRRTIKEMADRLGRDPSSVRARMIKMGLPTGKKKEPEKDLPMSESDIVMLFRQAANKPLQIGILADLNCTTRAKIAAILKKNGYEIPTTRAKMTIPKGR